MKTKTLFLAALFFAITIANAQITYSLSIPDSLPNYDGSYDAFGQAQLYYPAGGEVRYNDRTLSDASDEVYFYTMNTHPKRYLLKNNNISLCYAKADTATRTIDTLQRIDLEWDKSNSGAFLARVDTQNTAVLNYFTQWFSSTGRTDVHGGAAIACQSIYDNIDLVYTSNNGGLVMYFIVYPGGDYSDIRMHVNGSTANSIVSSKLKLEANWEYTTLEKPQMYQYAISGGTVIPVTVCSASWQSVASDIYGISTTNSYNPALPLIIQLKQANVAAIHTPGLTWSTYFGGSYFDLLTKTHTDASDNLYVAGYSDSPSASFPHAQGVSVANQGGGDGAIIKFDNHGVLQWSAFIGGSSRDEIHDFDFKGDTVYCVGKTDSQAWQMTPKSGATNHSSFGGGAWDGFICEFTFQPGTGVIHNEWLTYYGGDGEEELNGCKFDGAGNFFVVGESSSTNMTPMGPSGSWQQSFNPFQFGGSSVPLSTDGIIAKFDNNSSQTWFTYFGTDALGTNAHNHAGDYLYGLTINGTDLYACGKAGGTNLPNKINNKIAAGRFDGILVHFTTGGVLNNSKFTNGNLSNYAVTERGGNVYTVGEADSSMIPVKSCHFYYAANDSGPADACFSVHTQNLDSTIHNTYLGGDTYDAAYDIQFSSNNLFYITGLTNSRDFPTNNLSPMYFHNANPTPGGLYLDDNFIACFQTTDTNLVWSSYFGSQAHESSEYPTYLMSQQLLGITSIAVDSQDALYLLGWTGSYNTFPRDEWTGIPVYFQPQTSGADEGTITRFEVSAINSIVGIEDFKNTKFVFGLYPNPTARQISITNTAIAKDNLSYAIYDMSGKKLKAGNLKAGDPKNIDVSFLPLGIYVINVSNGVKTFSNKFVKAEN